MSTVEDLCENISLVDKSKIVLQGNVAQIRASHATNTYMLQSTKNIDPLGFELVETVQKNGIFESKIKKNASDSNNALLEKLMSQTDILSFQEILPSMNDIFIQTVSTPQQL